MEGFANNASRESLDIVLDRVEGINQNRSDKILKAGNAKIAEMEEAAATERESTKAQLDALNDSNRRLREERDRFATSVTEQGGCSTLG